MAQCDADDLISQACQSGFTCRNEPELLALLNQLLCNLNENPPLAGGGYPVILQSTTTFNPADSLTNYFGVGNGLSTPTSLQSFDLTSIQVPKAGTITRVFVKVKVSGTLASSETVQHFVRINDTTDVGQVDLDYSAVQQSGVNSTVSQAVVAGDMIALKVVTPAWVTNPIGVVFYAMAFIE